MDLSQVATPALLLDVRAFEANCVRMRAKAASLGVGLRPHMKTLKSIDAARIAIDPAHGGIAVSTLREAEYFAGHGIGDIQYAVCITPDKLPRAAAIARSIPRFGFFLDSVETAEAVAAFARANGVPFRAWIEIDCGDHRTGLAPDSDALPAVAAALGDLLAGVATHGGHSYRGDAAKVAETERQAVVSAAERLRAAGHKVAGISAGSTPTASHAVSGEGLTELRPGVYMAGDLYQSAIGSMAESDIAVSVLATVVSQGRESGKIVLDSGALALSKDRSTASLPDDQGYGAVVDETGRRAFGPLIVAAVSQEHGEVPIADPALFGRLPIGTKLRVLPNHACMTTAMYDRYLLVDGGEVIGAWEKCGGW